MQIHDDSDMTTGMCSMHVRSGWILFCSWLPFRNHGHVTRKATLLKSERERKGKKEFGGGCVSFINSILPPRQKTYSFQLEPFTFTAD